MWPKVRLDSLCEVTSSKRIFAADYISEGVPFYRAKEISEKHNGAIKVSSPLFISRSQFETIRNKFGAPRPGDLLLTSIGALLGEPYVVKYGEEFYFKDGNLTWFRKLSGIHSHYLYYWMISPQGKGELERAKIGSAQPAFTIALLKQMTVDLPPVSLQQRIASILSAYDNLIENNTRRIKILEETAQMIYREWFVHFRFPGHENVGMVESELGPIPEGFTAEPLEAVCRRITDGSHWSPKSADEGMPMASVKDMHSWGLNLSTCRKVSKPNFDDLTRNDCKPLQGDVLIAKDGSYLKHCFWMQKPLEVVILSSIAILRPNERITPSYLSLHLLDPQIKSRMAGYVSGVAIPRIVLKDFRKFVVLVPSRTVQATFSAITEPLMQLCWSMTEKNAALRTTRDFLLPKLISGEISVEAADEAAAQLMEQIA